MDHSEAYWAVLGVESVYQPLMCVMVCNSCCGVMCLWGLKVHCLTVIALRFKDTDAINYPQLCSQAVNVRNAAYENAIFAHSLMCSVLFIPRAVCLLFSKGSTGKNSSVE